MARWAIEVEVVSGGDKADVEWGVREALKAFKYQPSEVTATKRPEPFRLGMANPAMVRRATGPETYRVVIPGLVNNGEEVSIPVWEDDVDLELLAHILDNKG